jgi:hypothetical protein
MYLLLQKAFYQQHMILLGMVYLVMFGAVEAGHLAEYHLQLIKGSLSGWGALSLVSAIWILYFGRVLVFLVQVIENKQNGLLQQLTLLQPALLNRWLFYTIATCLLPISSYATAIVLWGSLYGIFIKVSFILLLFMAMHFAGIVFLRKKLNNTEMHFGFISRFRLYRILPKIYPFQFYLQYVWSGQKLQWLVIKLIMVLSIGLCFSGNVPGEEMRFSIFFFAMLFLIHTNLLRQFIIWENTECWYIRQLPISNTKKWFNYLLFFSILIFPEIFLLVKSFPRHLSFAQLAELIMLCVGLFLLVFTACMATDNITTDYVPFIFLVLLLTYIATLAEIILPFSISMVLVSYFVYNRVAARFELRSGESDDSYS